MAARALAGSGSGRQHPGRDVSATIPPIRADLAGREPYLAAPPAAPVRLNVNENPCPPPREVAGAIADAVAAEIGSLNRYPDATASNFARTWPATSATG